MFYNSKFKYKSFRSIPINNSLLYPIIDLIDTTFYESTENYLSYSNEKFRQLVKDCQDKINESQFANEFCLNHIEHIKKYVEYPLSTQTNIYLRATRPIKAKQEAIDFHREVFYSEKCMNYAYNIWIPLKNVTNKNSLFYVPLSHHIPDEKIQVKIMSENASTVSRFSNGHKIGLLYSPKKIVSGVDLSRAKRLPAKKCHFILFPADLIHGKATNNTNTILFSLDFRIIPQSRLNKNKAFHFASGNSYFTNLIRK